VDDRRSTNHSTIQKPSKSVFQRRHPTKPDISQSLNSQQDLKQVFEDIKWDAHAQRQSIQIEKLSNLRSSLGNEQIKISLDKFTRNTEIQKPNR